MCGVFAAFLPKASPHAPPHENSTDANSHLLSGSVLVQFRAMDLAIAKHLRRRGVYDTRHLRTSELTFSERNRNFFEWFHHSVMGFDTEEYRKKFWREVYRTGHVIGDVPYTLDEYLRGRGLAYRNEMSNLLFYALLLGGCFAAWFMRRQIDKHIRRLKRPGYYERELARRKELAAERRKLRERRTVNDRPTEEELRIAFRCANESPAAMIRFGSLLEDLECYVDNSAIFDDSGNLVGRRGGIRQYLRDKMPDLSARYKTVMRYKALARKFRQAFGVSDPIPAVALLPDEDVNCMGGEDREGRKGRDVRKGRKSGEHGEGDNLGKDRNGRKDGDENKIEKSVKDARNGASEQSSGKTARNARGSGLREFASVTVPMEVVEMAGRMLEGCENSFVSVAAAVEVCIGPDYAPKTDPNAIANAAQNAVASDAQNAVASDAQNAIAKVTQNAIVSAAQNAIAKANGLAEVSAMAKTG